MFCSFLLHENIPFEVFVSAVSIHTQPMDANVFFIYFLFFNFFFKKPIRTVLTPLVCYVYFAFICITIKYPQNLFLEHLTGNSQLF